MIKVLLADDVQILRAGLRAVLAQDESIKVVGEAGNGREAYEMAVRLQPDVVLMDLQMPKLGGAEATARMFDIMLGDDLAGRKNFITLHGAEYLKDADI